MATALLGAPLLSAAGAGAASTVGLLGAGGVFAPSAGLLASAASGTLGTLVSYAGVASTVMGGLSAYSSGRQQEASAKFNAIQQDLQTRQAGIRATEAQTEARRSFLKSLSAAQASYSTRGVSLSSGTPFTAQLQAAGDAQRDINTLATGAELDRLQGQQQAEQYRIQGRAYRQAGTSKAMRAGFSLLSNEGRGVIAGKV